MLATIIIVWIETIVGDRKKIHIGKGRSRRQRTEELPKMARTVTRRAIIRVINLCLEEIIVISGDHLHQHRLAENVSQIIHIGIVVSNLFL